MLKSLSDWICILNEKISAFESHNCPIENYQTNGNLSYGIAKKSDGNKEKKIKYIIQKYVCMFRKESEESWVDVDSSGSMFYIAMFIMRPKNQIKRREIYRWI